MVCSDAEHVATLTCASESVAMVQIHVSVSERKARENMARHVLNSGRQ